MAETKRYYWLRLMSDFFNQPKIKKLRRIAGGDTYTIIYLKLQLLSLKNGAKLYFEGIEDTFVEELALTIDEDVENVKVTVMYLINQGLLEEVEENEFVLNETIKNIGSETASAQRTREYRKRKNDTKLLQCDNVVTDCDKMKQTRHVEIEIEKELELELELNKEIKKELELNIDISPEPKQKTFITLPLNTQEDYPIYENDVDEYKKIYLNVDIEQQLRCMKGWLLANPTRRKTKKGIKRFIHSWLQREQDKTSFQKNNNIKKYENENTGNFNITKFDV